MTEQELYAHYQTHYKALRGYAESFSYRGSHLRPQDAEDVLQEVLRRFLRVGLKVKVENPKGLLVTLTKREAIRFLSTLINGTDAMDNFGYDEYKTEDQLIDDEGNAHTRDPMELMLEDENRYDDQHDAEQVLTNLIPNEDHRLIYLLALDDMDFATIAEKFEISVRTVQDIVYSCRTKVRAGLGE